MKFSIRKILLIIVFTQYFNSFAMIDFFNNAKITNALKNSPFINSWETLPRYRQILRGALIGFVMIHTELPITDYQKKAIFAGGYLMLISRNIYVIKKIKDAQNAQKTIKNIVSVLTEDKKGLQKVVKIFRFMKNNYARDLFNTLSTLNFAKTKLALLSSEKLATLIYTETLRTLIDKLAITKTIDTFYLNYKANKIFQNFCLKNSKLIDQVNSEILPLITNLNQVNLKPSNYTMLLSMALLIYTTAKGDSNKTLRIIAMLLLISKFDYFSLIKSNLYFEFLFTILNFVNLTKNSQRLVEKVEKENFFSKLDKSMWAEDLKNSENPDLNRVANVYFLTKIKKAISDGNTEVKEEDCVDFQDFIHTSIYEHSFCKQDCPGNSSQVCRLLGSYGFLNSVHDTFLWMISDMEKNNIIYKFEETEEKKRIEYKSLKGEYQIKKLCIQEEMLTLKKNITTEEEIEHYSKEKIKDKAEKEKRIVLEEIKYVILNDYQPKDHPDFKNNLHNYRYFKKNKGFTQEFISKKLVPGLTWALKIAAWKVILDFPHEKLHSLIL